MAPLIIVGSGLAAYNLAREWRRLDTSTPLLMVTQSKGDFYSKPLLSTALTRGKTAADLSMKSAEAMAQQLNATILTETSVTAIDRLAKTVTIQGQPQAYSRLVLALGASPIKLPLAGDAVAEAVSINNLEDYARFESWLVGKQDIVVLGSGLVGCELTNDLINTARRVTVAALDASPLARFLPAQLGSVFERVMAEQGVKWQLSVSTTALMRDGDKCGVQLDNGEQITTDGVILAVGLQAEMDLARAAGLSVDRAIEVDAYLQTNDDSIYALGDCAAVEGQVLQYVAPLLVCSRALAKTLSGERTAVQYPPMPVVIKTPSCPVVALPPPVSVAGEWQIEGEAREWRARFIDTEAKLRGFALLGEAAVSSRAELLKVMAAV